MYTRWALSPRLPAGVRGRRPLASAASPSLPFDCCSCVFLVYFRFVWFSGRTVYWLWEVFPHFIRKICGRMHQKPYHFISWSPLSLARPFACSLPPSLTRWLVPLLARSLPLSFARSLPRSLTPSLLPALSRSLARSLSPSLARSLAPSFARSLALLSIRDNSSREPSDLRPLRIKGLNFRNKVASLNSTGILPRRP